MKRIVCLALAVLIMFSMVIVASAEEWECGNCGKTNTGKFCSNCGSKVPEWECAECGATNIGKFCTECGAMNKTIVGNDLIIASAVEAFTNYDVVGALTLLDTAENLTDAQQNLVDALRAEIEGACYEGTHFIKFEYMENLTVNGSKLIGTIKKGGYTYQCSAYGKQTAGTDLTYYTYHMNGKGDFGFAPANDYTAYLGNSFGNCVMSFMEERKDLWYAWVLNGTDKQFPTNMYIDDLGNMLVWNHGVRSSTNWKLDLSIRLAD